MNRDHGDENYPPNNKTWENSVKNLPLDYGDRFDKPEALVESLQKKAMDRQAGGSHYKDLPIQPLEYAQRNQLNYAEANVVKYVTRHKEKGKAEDIHKAIHMLECLLELEYEE